MRYSADSHSDGDLLRRYVEERSEAAFAELGVRYAGLVFATCLRETQDRGLAEDASQTVFLLLCQKASSLQHRQSVASWLYTAARYVARNQRKQERRRQINEAEAMESTKLSGEASGTASGQISGQAENRLWDSIEPHLHDALDRLKSTDREAVLLRFVAEQSFAEVGTRLGLSENTARMRVNRAVEKIRNHLGKVGIAVSAGLLVTLLEREAAVAAPATLLTKLSPTGVGATAIGRISLPPFIGTFPPMSPIVRNRLFAALGAGAVLLLTLLIYPLTQPQRLSAIQRRQLYASLVGKWQGNLEFIDDGNGKRYTYPTMLSFQTMNQGNDLSFTATYAGSAAVDTTSLVSATSTGKITVSNGGLQSSHRLSGVGDLVRLREGGYAFVGESIAMNAAVRLRIWPSANRLTIQEEYRRPDQPNYQFRNRFIVAH